MAQLVPLPLTVTCSSIIQIGFTFLVPAHLGSLGQRAPLNVCVCVCISSSCARCAPVVASRWLASRRRAAAAAAVRAPGAAGPRTPRVCSWDCRPLSAFNARKTTGLGLAGVASHSRVFLAVVVVFGVCWLPLHGYLLLLYTTTWAFASSLDPPHRHLLLLLTPTGAPAPSLYPTQAFASLTPYTGMCSFSIPPHGHLLH